MCLLCENRDWLPPVSSYNVSRCCFLPPCFIWFWNKPLGMEIKRDRKKEGCCLIKSSMICSHRMHSSFIAWAIGFIFFLFIFYHHSDVTSLEKRVGGLLCSCLTKNYVACFPKIQFGDSSATTPWLSCVISCLISCIATDVVLAASNGPTCCT